MVTQILAVLEVLLKVEPYAQQGVTDLFRLIDLWKTNGVEPTQEQLDQLRLQAENARQTFDRESD